MCLVRTEIDIIDLFVLDVFGEENKLPGCNYLKSSPQRRLYNMRTCCTDK